MWNALWIISGILLLLWMFRKGGCCGIGRKPMMGGEGEMGEKTKDPVCGMELDSDSAAAKSEHMGKTFYFCAQACKEKFDQDPMKYMGKKEEGGGGCCH